MHTVITRFKARPPICALLFLGLLADLLLSSYRSPTGTPPSGTKRSPVSSNKLPAGVTPRSPLPIRRVPVVQGDPIRFRLHCNKQTVRLGETIELTITAELLNVSPNLLFSLPGANAYRLKLLLPAGFEQTGGDFRDYVGDELSYPSHALVTYRVTGHFTAVPANTGFRLLRSHAQADGQSLFVEKAGINLKSLPAGTSRRAIEADGVKRAATTPVLYVVNETALSTARVAAPSYRGYLEFAQCDIIGGWAADRNALGQSVSVDIFINGVKAATILADQDRQDVADGLRSNTNKYGFRWNVPDSFRTNTPLTFAAKFAGTSSELEYSPRTTGTCVGTTRPPRPRPDSCAFTATAPSVNAGCGNPVILQAECSGANCNRVSYTWSGNGLSRTGQSVSFNAPPTNGVYPYTLTASATGCTTQTATAAVTVTNCPTTTPPVTNPCAFSLTTKSVSASCGSLVTLRADCSGPNCDGISYAWSGNGLSQSGQSASFNAPTTNGVYSYTVTATRPGCTAQTTTATVTVNGCSITPPVVPAPSANPNYVGIIDLASCSSVVGWIFDRNTLQQSASVDVFINGTKAATVLANEPRSDVANAFGITGFNRYGYSFVIPDSLKRGGSLLISVRPAGMGNELTGSPYRTPDCPKPTPSPNCAFSLTTSSVSASCGSSVTLRADCNGPNCDGLSYGWSGNGISQSGQSVSFSAPTTNGVYSYTVTVTRPGCSARTEVATVTVNGCTTTPPPPTNGPCAFSLTTNSVSASCGSSVTLRAECSGPNCDGLSYAWLGNGLSQSGQSVSFNAPTTNGVYSYTVTVTRPGCSARTEVATVTVNGCSSTPPPPANGPCAFSLTTNSVSASCGSSVTLRADCSGANCDGLSYGWSGNGISQAGQFVTFNAPTTNGVYSYTVTVTRPGCSARTEVATVTVNGCSATPPSEGPCAFNITTSSVNASCGSSVTLRAECSGANCDGLSYAWSGNGLSQSGQSVSFNAPTTNGTYSYTVTVTRPGCSARTEVATVTVNGCTTTPPPPGDGQYPILNSPPPADKRPVLQNDRVRVAIDLGVGAVIREVTDLQVGENMINCMVKSDGVRDPGRDDQISVYGLPDANKRWTINGKPILDDIGYNPVQGGDVAGNFSPVLGYGRTDQMLYSKTRGLHWGINNEPGDYVVEQWIRLEGNVVKRHVRITGDRPDQTRYSDTRQQELPCTYTNSAYYQYYVVQGTPYTNAPLVNVNSYPNLTGDGRRLEEQHRGGISGPYDIDASEPWIVAVRPSNNRGIALHTPFSHEFKVGLFGEIGWGPPESGNAGYIANGVSLFLDRNGVYEFDINMVVGTLDEIRRTVNTLPRSETKPNYVFANQATRHGFYYRKGYDQGFPVGDELSITPVDRRFRFTSPRKGYQASEFRTIFVRLRANTPETQLALEWRKVGQTELQAAQAGQFVTFNITGDNQYRTIAIPVGGNSRWDGLINDFTIRYVNPSETPINGQQIGIKWISASNLGDQ